MAKLLFDPRTYQFYFRAGSENCAAKAAGFRWDPLRLRYYTDDPNVAVRLAGIGSSYVKRLLSDALDTVPSGEPTVSGTSAKRISRSTRIPMPSTAIH
jgi:hypothetical protein